MKQNEQGIVIPFGLSGSRMRRSAQEYRRRGQPLEALALVRRAAEQEDTAHAWQVLAAELYQLDCWEAAAVILGRVLSREDHAPSAWLDMAQCQMALGRKALAADCLYHLLQEDPWSPEGDAARAMLPEAEEEPEESEPHRVNLLVQRGMQAWNAGDRDLGVRRLKRALRISVRRKAHVTSLLVALCLVEDDFLEALGLLRPALRKSPRDPQILCTLANVLCRMNKGRMGRAFLRGAARYLTNPRHEANYIAQAWLLKEHALLLHFVNGRLRKSPCRTSLLDAKATFLYVSGTEEEATALWRQILSIDPSDRRAAAMLTWLEDHWERQLPPPGQLPPWTTPLQIRQAEAALQQGENPMQPGSGLRRLLDWMSASEAPAEQSLAFRMAAEQPDREAEIRFLREILCRPDVADGARQKAMMRLGALRSFGAVTLLLGDRYATGECRPAEKPGRKQPLRLMLPLLLREARETGCCRELVTFAAQVWKKTPPREAQEAALDAARWCRALTVLWLQKEGRSEEALQAAEAFPGSPRKLLRWVRRMETMLDNNPGLAGEGDKEQ